MMNHAIFVLPYACATCDTPYDAVWDSLREAEPPSRCPGCGSPVRRFVGAFFRARSERALAD